MPPFARVVDVVFALACAPPLHPIVAEVFYDAVGDDTGREFIELFNPHPVAFPLVGARLDVGDGSGPGRWSSRWTGGPLDTIPARGRFVVGGANVAPPPQALAALDLQNGPDAVRLVWPDGAVEVVGYGAHEFLEYACGSPAPDVSSGQSLARVPDGADGGSNALDFRAATPSPGRTNQPARDAAMVVGSLALVPEQPAVGAPPTLMGVVANRGVEPLAAAEVSLRGVEPNPTAPREWFLVGLARALSPGDTASFAVVLPGLDPGRHALHVLARLAGDEAPENDADSLFFRVGPGPLEITEIQFHPGVQEGEWVEVRNSGLAPLDLAAFRLADRHEAPGAPAGGGGPLEPDSLALLSQDRRALLARYAALDSLRVWQVSPWPSLNNSDDSSGVADIVVLREADGVLSDRVGYSGAGTPAGVPIERRADGSWGPSPVSMGTPLEPPRPFSALVGRFDVHPRRLGVAGSQARLAWALPWTRARVSVDVYDLAGRRVVRALPETAVAGRAERTWDAGELRPGLYLVVLRGRDEAGGETFTEALPVRMEGGVR